MKNKTIFGGIALVAVVVLYFVTIYPWPAVESTEGTIGGVKKYNAGQLSDKDVKIEGQTTSNSTDAPVSGTPADANGRQASLEQAKSAGLEQAKSSNAIQAKSAGLEQAKSSNAIQAKSAGLEQAKSSNSIQAKSAALEQSRMARKNAALEQAKKAALEQAKKDGGGN
jgi:hypothetical protein